MVEKVIRTPYGAHFKDEYDEKIYADIRAVVITDKKEIDLWGYGGISCYDRFISRTITALAPVGEQYFVKGVF